MTAPRRPNGKADRAARRIRWEAGVNAQMLARYGAEPVGPGLPALLDEWFRAQVSPVHVVDRLGKRFDLQELESWKEGQS